MKLRQTFATIAVALLAIAGFAVPRFGQASPPQLQGSEEVQLSRNVAHLSYNQKDVREALRELFRMNGTAYSIAPEVQGTVTLELNNVTFESALQNVLRQVDATYRIEGGVFNVIHRDDVEPVGQLQSEPVPVDGFVQDGDNLYVIRRNLLIKVRKKDLRVVGTTRLPG